ncbi:MAG: hypothetical protein WCJ49_00015 [Deltaproteobacteria bacterium]
MTNETGTVIPCLVSLEGAPQCNECQIESEGFCETFCSFIKKKKKEIDTRLSNDKVDDFLSTFFIKVSEQTPNVRANDNKEYVKLINTVFNEVFSVFINPNKHSTVFLCLNYLGMNTLCGECPIMKIGYCDAFCTFIKMKMKVLRKELPNGEIGDFLSGFFMKILNLSPKVTATVDKQYVRLLNKNFRWALSDFKNPKKNTKYPPKLISGIFWENEIGLKPKEKQPSDIIHTTFKNGKQITSIWPIGPKMEEKKDNTFYYSTVSTDSSNNSEDDDNKETQKNLSIEMQKSFSIERDNAFREETLKSSMMSVLDDWIQSETDRTKRNCAQLFLDWIEKSDDMTDKEIAVQYGIASNNYTHKKIRCTQLLKKELLAISG